MFVTKKKHEAVVSALQAEFDEFKEFARATNKLALDRIDALHDELGELRASKARQVANLTAANARRREAAKAKREGASA
jgi:hypothetical protein